MAEVISGFLDAMRESGCATDSPIKADDRVNRFQVVGDRKGKLNGSYQLAIEGGFAFGWFRDHKEGVTHKWYSKLPNMTEAEKAELKRKIDERRAAAEKERKDTARAARNKAESLWKRAVPAEGHEYLARKGIKAYGIRVWRGVLLIPAFDERGISTIQFITGAGEKRFLTGGVKNRSWFTIMGTKERVAVCEGYATAASIHEATGWTALVVFDSGNMKSSARQIRSAYPDSEIIICADEDRFVFRNGARPETLSDDRATWPDGENELWVEWRAAGMLQNPGIEAAHVALKGVGGKARLKTPKFTRLHSRPTDFNDLHALEGLDRLREILLTEPETAGENEPPPFPEAEWPSIEELQNYIPVYEPENIEAPIAQGPFKIMGYNQGKYYYLPRNVGQLIELSPSSHTKQNLMQLAPLEWWRERFGTSKGVVSWDYVADALIQLCHERGVFKTDTNLRGAGVWMDRGRVVVHMGDRLMVDGEEKDPFELGSAFVYQKTQRVFEVAKDPLGSMDAIKLQKICQCCTFTNKLSPILLAGWVVIAPLSGALSWRPHLWIDGEAEAGKSYVMNQIVKRVLNKVALRVGSGTTEPGIRRLLGHDSRPVVMDEMEGENEKDQETLQAILLLARKASSGETIVQADSGGKGTVFYNIYSTFCLSSINSSVKQRADMMRFSHLALQRNTAPDAGQQFKDLKEFVKETLTDEFSARLLARTLGNIRVLLKNIDTFSEAAAEVLKTRRAGDQIGPMLAGAYSLHNEQLVTIEKAIEWIKAHEWSNHTAISEQSDHDKMFGHLMTAKIMVTGAHKRHETQIGNAIIVALGYGEADFTGMEARTALSAIDIKIKEQHVWIRKPSQHIDRLLRGTPWSVSWAKTLVGIDGIAMSKSPQAFGGSSAYVVMIDREKFRPEDRML